MDGSEIEAQHSSQDVEDLPPSELDPHCDRVDLPGLTDERGAVAPVAVSPAAAVDPGKEETKSRYRETDHIKNYYRTNRY